MIIARKKNGTVHSVPFMGMNEAMNGVIPDEGAIQIREPYSFTKRDREWEWFLSPAENLALIARSMEEGK